MSHDSSPLILLYFSHLPIGRHVLHNLCIGFESQTEHLATCQNIDLALSSHIVLEQVFLFFCEAVDSAHTRKP